MTEQDKKNLSNLLHLHNLKATPQRLAILSILNRAKRPFTVRQIIKQLTIPANQATVYRTLSLLKKANVISQADFQHNHAHYEFSLNNERHHVICTNCSRIATVNKCEAPHVISTALKQSDFASINNHTLQFYGLCKKCQPV